MDIEFQICAPQQGLGDLAKRAGPSAVGTRGSPVRLCEFSISVANVISVTSFPPPSSAVLDLPT